MIENLKVGILGGGQLGGMLIRHAIDLGLSISVMDKDPNAPCARYTSSFVCADPKSYEDVLEFGKGLDVITIEMEAVNIDALRELEKQGKKVFPTPDTIKVIQDKFTQKQFLLSHNIPVVPGDAIEDRNELYKYENKLPGCLKKRRNGYDGYGVMVLKSGADIATAFDEPCVLEELVDIKHEIAVIVARNEHGAVTCYDPVMMVFSEEKFVLESQVAPAQLAEGMQEEATRLAEKIADALQLVGILAVEMFVTKDNRILVNELAPRPHNSGHHTIEASTTSQYEQLLRAILGLPLGDTSLHLPSLMLNLLETAALAANRVEKLKALLDIPGAHLHWYGKKGSRIGRKVGHVTITGSTMEAIAVKAETIREILN
ncbi:5-(carboxyamino)imidazole ribonucleotide synthase [Chitinophaga pinensis]|uniref:N5-carboxyaminoimidazole ribonucleotide synthase n=1 Tax=Chitinophaga pinensis (strain ATCC 43595 / DSM 2588 / LMG 13176 / NBRC 15968 / NCIMB 11800 / UQM 2034) TaxID=485918 RepID=A0A979G9J4_CHIPD|nr:5-(carboxyamino)imidazole ribonucleotide synthase [Chitinophaga pinensis]ACU63128.1 phosphoribosylaminoimidazole carboxylase, ATPase subunit [Chitinophaga pinensis DSM 2588]